ncbi:uncharacterized protein N7529_003436 [Penicillium soppii]|uniref:uncharacterized protein n=1 Tax=Penicillium soppii TaxID=69789 RepID=UPI0025484874|nr:uncharacterized protein N7529_003436 [Penicillium soppii]KAJ5871083.1 hypothetical protein N7529_003436 [Penicillium soppii]
MTKAEFIEWWRQTIHGGQEDIQKKIRWDAKHISEGWKQFDQVAHYTTGEPLILCRLCGIILPHPMSKPNGTNTINRHPNSAKCRYPPASSTGVRTRAMGESADRPYHSA